MLVLSGLLAVRIALDLLPGKVASLRSLSPKDWRYLKFPEVSGSPVTLLNLGQTAQGERAVEHPHWSQIVEKNSSLEVNQNGKAQRAGHL